MINSNLLHRLNIRCVPEGTVKIRGVIGQPVEATLSWLYMQLPEYKREMYVICAIPPDFNDEFILPATVISRLSCGRLDDDDTDPGVTATESGNPVGAKEETQAEVDDLGLLNVSTVILDDSESNEVTKMQESEPFSVTSADEKHDQSEQGQANCSELIKEQRTDPSLTKWQQSADQKKGGLAHFDGLLYKKEFQVGHVVWQLCLPESRRRQAFDLAHSTSHLSVDKVMQRLRLSFNWPNMKADVVQWTNQCDICQKKRKVTYLDRTPITPVLRAELPFSHLFIDCFGPLFPELGNTGIGPKPQYNYALVVICSCTEFSFSYASSSMSAKAGLGFFL